MFLFEIELRTVKYTNVCLLGVDFQLKAWHSLSFGERKTRLDSPQLPGQQEKNSRKVHEIESGSWER